MAVWVAIVYMPNSNFTYRPVGTISAWQLFLIAIINLTAIGHSVAQELTWTNDELSAIKSFWLGHLPPAQDASNRYLHNPTAAKLGKRFFEDKRFSADGKVACASCHLREYQFTDPAIRSSGLFATRRHAMTLIGAVYSPFQFWDGRVDSLWAQALAPLESAEEHGTDRTYVAHLVAQHYRQDYEQVFGALPNVDQLPEHAGPVRDESAQENWQSMDVNDQQKVTRIFVNVGKAIAAFEATLLPKVSRFDLLAEHLIENNNFDDYKNEVSAALRLNQNELLGLKLFIGKAQCGRCHLGPLFTNNEFFNTGVPPTPHQAFDAGRLAGAQQVKQSEFSCLSQYSDADPGDCVELTHVRGEGEELVRAFKVPSLRNVAQRPPYMHTGLLTSLSDVLNHYNSAPQPDVPVGHTELQPLNLNHQQLQHIEAFLHTLNEL